MDNKILIALTSLEIKNIKVLIEQQKEEEMKRGNRLTAEMLSDLSIKFN